MKLRIEQLPAGLSVRIDGIAGHEHAVAEKIRACRGTAWACPSGACLNIGTIEEQPGSGWVVLKLTPCPGEQLSAGGIEQCMHYMLQEFAK
jgi:hypothetical protein